MLGPEHGSQSWSVNLDESINNVAVLVVYRGRVTDYAHLKTIEATGS
jgi:hypothetical protein